MPTLTKIVYDLCSDEASAPNDYDFHFVMHLPRVAESSGRLCELRPALSRHNHAALGLWMLAWGKPTMRGSAGALQRPNTRESAKRQGHRAAFRQPNVRVLDATQTKNPGPPDIRRTSVSLPCHRNERTTWILRLIRRLISWSCVGNSSVVRNWITRKSG